MASQVVVRITGLTYSYPPNLAGSEVLRDVNIDVLRASRVVLVGQNGAGKSTLLNLVAGKMMTPQNTVTVMGKDAFRCTGLQKVVSLISADWSAAVGAMHTVTFNELMAAVLSTVEAEMRDLVVARAARLKMLLGVDEKWQIGATSEGQKRRAQLVLKLMIPRGVVMLDEATTDLDIIARQNLLQFLFEESAKRSVTVIYCTHIFDGMEGWATHAVHVGQKTVLRAQECSSEPGLLGQASGGMYEVVKRWMRESMPPDAQPENIDIIPHRDAGSGIAACDVRSLAWGYRPRVLALRGATCRVPAGSRCLVTGGNGAGKSTLLSIVAGKHRVDPDSVTVLGFRAFEDYRELGGAVQLLSQEWRQTLRCVGVAGSLTFRELTQSMLAHLDGDESARGEVASRLRALEQAMHVDPSWACNQVSDGQLRRMQLAIKLATPSRIVLLDEASVDLDILGRDALLEFLRAESEQHGVTVVYCTHILDGLEGWATHHVHLHAGTVSMERSISLSAEPDVATGSGVGSRLYQLVQGVLRKDAATTADADPDTMADVADEQWRADSREALPTGWFHRQTAQPGAYGSNKWDDKDDGLAEPSIRPWLGEGDLLDDDSDLSVWEGAAPLQDRPSPQPAASGLLLQQPAHAAIVSTAPPVSAPPVEKTTTTDSPGTTLGDAERQQVEMLEGLVATAAEKLGDEVTGLVAAVKSREGGVVEASRGKVRLLWEGMQPALLKLEELLGKPDPGDQAVPYSQFLAEQGTASGGGDQQAGDSDGLPWGFGSRTNQVSEAELQKQGKVLADRPTVQSAPASSVVASAQEELPFGFGSRHNQTAPDELLRQGKILPDRPQQ